MKTISLIIVLLLSFSVGIVTAQTPSWVWARGATGPDVQEGVAVATDHSGNVYFCGFFEGDSITFDTITLYRTGTIFQNLTTPFIVKYSPSGAAIWARGTNPYSGIPTSIATDGDDNVFMTGYNGLTDSISFDGQNFLTDSGGHVAFVVKYDSAGNVLWSRAPAGTGYTATPAGISTDPAGNAYITGSFVSDSLVFGSYTIYSRFPADSGYTDPFIVKYSPAGAVLWAGTVDAHSAGSVGGTAIAADGTGHLYAAGTYHADSITIGSTVLHRGISDIASYIAKYDSAGHVLWARSTSGPSQDVIKAIAADTAGAVYVTGAFYLDSISFGANAVYSNDPSTVRANFFLAKYSSLGTSQWAYGATSPKEALAYSITTDLHNTVYVAGSFFDSLNFDGPYITMDSAAPDPMFIATFDAKLGYLKCAAPTSSGGDDIMGISVDRSGNIYVGGDFEDPTFILSPDTLRMSSSAVENAFVAKFNCDLHIGIPEVAANNTFEIFPDPFRTEATVRYTLPLGTAAGSLILYDITGRRLDSIHLDISAHEATISAYKLSAGLYFYTLIADGKQIAAKSIVVD